MEFEFPPDFTTVLESFRGYYTYPRTKRGLGNLI